MEVLADPALLEASHAYCQRQTKQHARSFYFASVALPREKKQAAYAVYAFCRYADDLVDAAVSTEGVDVALQKVEEEFDRLAAGAMQEPPFAPAFAWAVQRYQIERQPFLDLLKGVAMDLGPVKIADWPELRGYRRGLPHGPGLSACGRNGGAWGHAG